MYNAVMQESIAMGCISVTDTYLNRTISVNQCTSQL